MPKEKVTLSLETKSLKQLRRLCGKRSLSASVDAAVHSYIARLRHLRAIDDWLVDLEREHGPIPTQTLEWAAKLIDEWDDSRPKDSRPKGRRAAG